MKKLIFIMLLLQACSQTKSDVSTSVVKFTESSGKIEIEFKGKEWKTIQSSGSASLLINDDNGLEQAMSVATMRAKANLIEFLNNEITSSKSTTTLLKSLIKEETNKTKASEIVSDVSEKIVSEARGSIKGAYVIERKVSPERDYVMVTILLDKKILEASKNVSLLLR